MSLRWFIKALPLHDRGHPALKLTKSLSMFKKISYNVITKRKIGKTALHHCVDKQQYVSVACLQMSIYDVYCLLSKTKSSVLFIIYLNALLNYGLQSSNTQALKRPVSTFLLMQMMIRYLHLPMTATKHCDILDACWRNK